MSLAHNDKQQTDTASKEIAEGSPASIWKWLIPLFVFLALVLLFVAGLHNDPGELPSERVGQHVPAFALPTLDDPAARITDSQLQGKPYLLNIWATWCPTCYVEHPYLLQLAQEQKVRIIGVNYKDDTAKAKDYLARLGNPYETVLVDSGRLGVDLGVYGAPETFLISASGEILYRRAGDMNEHVWQDEFLPRLTEAAR